MQKKSSKHKLRTLFYCGQDKWSEKFLDRIAELFLYLLFCKYIYIGYGKFGRDKIAVVVAFGNDF